MRASWYQLEDADDGSRSIIFTPGENGRTRCVGFVRPLPGGGFRARGTENGAIGVAASAHDAAAVTFPDDGFPDLCVRCEVNEPCGDAAAYSTVRGAYPADLDDHCEDCLDAGLADWDPS